MIPLPVVPENYLEFMAYANGGKTLEHAKFDGWGKKNPHGILVVKGNIASFMQNWET